MSDEPEAKKPDEDDDAWIEKVVNVAGHLGFNKMRLRWKLIRWQNNRRKAARVREQQITHIKYAHKTCPECGHVQDKDEAVCTSCGAKLGKRGLQVLDRLGILMPEAISMSTLAAIAMLVVYARVWIAQGGGFGAPSPYLLIDFGGRWPPYIADEPWRLVTSIFLHGGLWHIAFNLIAIATIGPRIEEIYGRTTMLAMLVITGVLANLGSLHIGDVAGVGVGASGGVCGLIGIAAGYGHRSGTTRGRLLRNGMLKWAAYTLIFGLAIRADNWAHLFGLIAGLAFGFAVSPTLWTRQLLLPARILVGIAGIVASLGAVVIIMTRQPTYQDEETAAAMYNSSMMQEQMAGMVTGMIDICVPYYAGDAPKAVAAAKKMYENLQVDIEAMQVNDVVVQETCDGLQMIRSTCNEDRSKWSADTRRTYEQMCTMYKPAFDAIPVRAPSTDLERP
ncbi:MAG: rhomboid family intramembrane serine protease [Deltaproteobacteria bacterium]|nr:rhomboid family intramembrane serine protease [Deltaproteobacteria bacterium]